MPTILRKSGWKFVTSNSGGIGVEFLVAEGGTIDMKDPQGNDVTFTYGAAGAGLALGIKIPKIGKINFQALGKSVGAVASPAAFPNTGAIYVLGGFPGTNLTRSDITGVCMIAEAGGGLIGGASSMAMLLGMNPTYLAAATALPGLGSYAEYLLVKSATCVLFMAGLNCGLIAGAGVSGMLGGLF